MYSQHSVDFTYKNYFWIILFFFKSPDKTALYVCGLRAQKRVLEVILERRMEHEGVITCL